mgnify:CR=1 FL=1
MLPAVAVIAFRCGIRLTTLTVALLAVGLTIGNLATRDNAFTWLIWVHATVPGALAFWWLDPATVYALSLALISPMAALLVACEPAAPGVTPGPELTSI